MLFAALTAGALCYWWGYDVAWNEADEMMWGLACWCVGVGVGYYWRRK
jgi:hypothetical protein